MLYTPSPLRLSLLSSLLLSTSLYASNNVDLNTFSTSNAQGFIIEGAAYGNSAGISVSNAGDINGDGIDDFIVGATGADPLGNRSSAGATYVIYGKNTATIGNFANIDLSTFTTSNAQGFFIEGAQSNKHASSSISNAGDINGDGIADIIVGAGAANPTGNRDISGAAYVIYGKNTATTGNFANIDLSTFTTSNAQGFIIEGANGSEYISGPYGFGYNTSGDRAGSSVSGAGDINGDGVNDLIVGTIYADPTGSRSESGAAYVIYGKNTATTGNFANIDLSTFSTSNAQGFIIEGAASGDSAGTSVSNAGDINGDGITDLIVGATGANPTGSRDFAGAAYVIYGKNTATTGNFANIDLSTFPTSSAQGFIIEGAQSSDFTGNSVSNAGDINGDGKVDLIVGAYNANLTGSRAGAGAAYIIYGQSTAVLPTAPASISSSTSPSMTATPSPSSSASACDECTQKKRAWQRMSLEEQHAVRVDTYAQAKKRDEQEWLALSDEERELRQAEREARYTARQHVYEERRQRRDDENKHRRTRDLLSLAEGENEGDEITVAEMALLTARDVSADMDQKMNADDAGIFSSQGQRVRSWYTGLWQQARSWWPQGKMALATGTTDKPVQVYRLDEYVQDCHALRDKPSHHGAFKRWLAERQAAGQITFERDFDADHEAGYTLPLWSLPASQVQTAWDAKFTSPVLTTVSYDDHELKGRSTAAKTNSHAALRYESYAQLGL